jgi:hypothetical protein
MQNETPTMLWRTKEAIMRWHSYQSPLPHARLKAWDCSNVCVKRQALAAASASTKD